MRQKLIRTGVVTTTLFALLAVPAAGNVTSPDDTSLPGELRYEVQNADPGDVIVIDPGVDPVVTELDIVIDKNLTIVGQGADETTITAMANFDRIFTIPNMPTSAGGDDPRSDAGWRYGRRGGARVGRDRPQRRRDREQR